METLVRIGWLSLAVIHVAPAAVFFAPTLVEKLYGVAPGGEAGVLLIHRGAMFAAVVLVCVWAGFSPAARPVAALIVGCSVVGFLGVYTRAGIPGGSLRTIALVDVVALAPLALVSWNVLAGGVEQQGRADQFDGQAQSRKAIQAAVEASGDPAAAGHAGQ